MQRFRRMKTTRPLLLVPSILALHLLACGGENRPARSADNVPPGTTSTGTTAVPTSSDVASIGPETATTSSLPTTPPTSRSARAPTEAQPPSSASDVPTPLTDAEILQVTHTANEGEIAQAQLAQRRSKDPRVQKLAAMMVKDHSAADAKGMTVAKRESLVPTPSATSTSLERDANSATVMLRSQNGADFDKSYVDTQVKEHQAVLDMIDQKLLPNAQDAEVKIFLTEVRGKVAMHLQHAQDLQSTMQK